MKERKVSLPQRHYSNRTESTIEPEGLSKRIPRHRQGEHFLKGPMPLGWLTAAENRPGKVLRIAIALWYRAGLTGSPTINLSNLAVSPFGVERDAKRRVLRLLEYAGLVTVDHPPHASPIVHLLDAPAGDSRGRPSGQAPGEDDGRS